MSSRTVSAAKTHELMLVSFMFVFVRPVCEDFIRNKFVKIDVMLQLPCSILVSGTTIRDTLIGVLRPLQNANTC